ncbi:MAG: asparaginase [archaeon]
MKGRKPRVLVIGMGGAISAKPVNGKWKYGEFPQEEVLKIIPGIREKYDIKATNIFRMDSSDMKPEHWLTLANTIYHNMKDYDGIVVTMGTDTMHYAGTAIAFLIQNNNIPIVFTGSQVDPTQLNTDARWNLREAITVAAEAGLAETVTVFNGRILRATRTKKINASDFTAFKSFGEQPLGKIQQFISLAGKYRKRSNSKPALYNKLEPRVAILKVYPGFDGKRVTRMVDYGMRGIIIEGYGLGNIPLLGNGMAEAIKYANKKNVAIAITSDCSLGSGWKCIYEAEIGARLKGMKAIPVYDMLTETAYVKLMWVLAQTTKYAEVKKMMQKSYVGEIDLPDKKTAKIR